VDEYAILETVAKAFHVTPEAIKGKRKWQRLALARQVAMYLMYEHGLNVSYPGIARVLGRDHSTIIHGHNLIAKKIKASKAYRQTIESIRQDIWLAAA
jgi:chromosomal replication initiator protein